MTIGSLYKQDTRYELRLNLSMLTFSKYFYITADDLNFRWKTILPLYNTHPSGNITVSFQHHHLYCIFLNLFAVYNENV